MRTSAEVLEGNTVKLTVEVDESDIAQAEAETLTRLTKEIQLPGFRPGHVPRRIIQSRLGVKGIRDEVLRDKLSDYYAEAIEAEDLDVIVPPQLDITSGEEGGPVVFTATVEVRPEVLVPGYAGMAVTVPSPITSEEDIQEQLDRMRDQFATLAEVDRPAADGDLVTLDIHGTRDGESAEGLTADDLVYQVGTGGIVEGTDEHLVGAKVGDTFEMDAEDAPDGPAHLEIAVKQIREKVLPEADDEFAADASEFDTIAALRDDLVTRMGSVKRFQATVAIREKIAESLAELVTEEPPEALVAEQRDQLVQDYGYRLSQQRVGLAEYLEAIGQAPEDFVAGLTEQAAKDVKIDLALRAIAKAEDLEPDESEIDEEVVHLAGHAEQSPAEMRQMLEANGRMSLLRSEIRKTKAMTWLVEHVAILDEAGNEVDRESLRVEIGQTSGQHDHGDDDEHDEHDHDEHDHEEE
ncbi:MAG TPA: trigger factor [Acidimicrobiales bacterium]